MDWIKPTIFLVLMALVAANPSSIPCLQGCQCETGVDNPTIRCDMRKLNYFPLPVTLPHRSFNFLELTCNDIATVPEYHLIMQAFPDLHGIDLQGNPHLNCTSLAQFDGKLPVLSDCDSAIPTACVAPEIVRPKPQPIPQAEPQPKPQTKPQFNTQPTNRPRLRSEQAWYCDFSCKNRMKLAQMYEDMENLKKKVTGTFAWMKDKWVRLLNWNPSF